MQLKPHMEGSSIYFVKLEQVPVLPCLLCHSFPAAVRLYPISSPFSTHPLISGSHLFGWLPVKYSVEMREAPFPSFTVVRVGKSLIFPRFPQFVVALLWEGWESLRSFSTLSTALFPLSCIKSGKVALSLSSDPCLQSVYRAFSL